MKHLHDPHFVVFEKTFYSDEYIEKNKQTLKDNTLCLADSAISLASNCFLGTLFSFENCLFTHLWNK